MIKPSLFCLFIDPLSIKYVKDFFWCCTASLYVGVWKIDVHQYGVGGNENYTEKRCENVIECLQRE